MSGCTVNQPDWMVSEALRPDLCPTGVQRRRAGVYMTRLMLSGLSLQLSPP